MINLNSLTAAVVGLSVLSWNTVSAATATFTTEIDGSTWSYTLSVSSDKTTTNATITAVTPADGALVVPSAVDGCPVVAIANGVCKGSEIITSLVIPDSVRTIGNGAFANCTSLGEVALGDGVTAISGNDYAYSDPTAGNYAFGGCTALTNVNFGTSLRTMYGAFCKCTSLERVTLPDSLVTIGADTFFGCTKLCSVVFGRNIETIGGYAFGNCPCLRWVRFLGEPPASVGDYAFNKMRAAAIVFCEDDNAEWPTTWNGYAVKPASEIAEDADAPWDLQFSLANGWPAAFFLSDATNSTEACTRFLAGNPIYRSYAVIDAWNDVDIAVKFTNRLYVSGIDRVSEHGFVNYLKVNTIGVRQTDLPDNLQNLAPGEYVATMVLNEPRSIRETNYANNSNSVTFVVVPSTAVTFMSVDYEVGTFNFEKGGTYGSTLPDAPVRFGYKFMGWFTAEEDGIRITESSIVPDGPTTLYAQWIAAPNETITVSGNPSYGTTWQSGNLYVIAENITVPSGVTLTIQAGAIIKFKAGKSLTVASGGTLRAQGTRAMPIVFTSINDDSNGGKTDGSTSRPNGGDWNRLQIIGTGIFDFCRIYYTGGTENYGGIECGGTVVFDNSEIAETKYECVNAHSGSFTAHNSIFRDSSLAFGYYGGSRVKVYNCVVANCTTAVRQSSKLFCNTIFYNCRNFTDQGGDGSKFYYCCFFNPVGYGDQNSAKYARETCIWGDPQFVDVDKNNYRIKATSPCVDAADGSVAPEFDYYGSPRMAVEGVRPTGTASADGAVPDIGIYEVPGTADVPAADLTVTAISAPETLTIGETVRVSWTLENIGEVDASGQWRDAVEIVTSNGQILELGEQIATLDVRVGRSQTFTGDFTVPCGTEGPCRIRVTANKYRDLFEGGRADNNALAAPTESELVVTAKDIPLDGTETPVALAAGNQAAFALNSLGGGAGLLAIRCEGDISAWLGNGTTATRGNAVRTAVQVAPDIWLLEIPAGVDPRVSLSNDGRDPSAIGLSLAIGDFFLCDIGRVTSLNAGTVTVPFAGVGFEDGIRCWLALNGSKVVEASEIMIHDSVSGSAVFDVNAFSPGVYSIVVQKGTDEDSVEVLELIRAQDAAARWNCSLDLAETTRANRTYVGRFEYENLGDAPMAVPYVALQSSGGTLIRLSESDAWTDSIDVLAISSTYPASSLKPGETGDIKFFYRSSGERATVTFKCAGGKRVVDERGQFFKVGVAQPMQNGVVVYQDAHKKTIRYTIVSYTSHVDDPNQIRMSADSLRPSSVDKLPWSFAHPKLADAFGDTWKTYIARLAEDADYLMKIGQPTYRVDKLLQLEMTDALGVDTAVPTLASATDIVRSGRGLDLAFTRTYSSSTSRRLTKGTLGYGWYGSYGTYAELKDAKTLIFHTPSGSSYSFTKVSGAWEPEDSRDQTVLTEADASYELASASGMVQKYSKGTMRLASIEDNQGNSLTFAYAGTKVSRVTHSDGQYLSFTYSGDLLTSVSDDLGHTVSYSYDGDKLASVTRVDGLVTHYAYRGDDGSSCAKALVQITASDGVTRDFTYASDGRLATVSVNGDKQTTRIVRGKFGSYTIVAPDGGETSVTVGMNGETLKTVNALGQTVREVYTTDSLLESIIAPSGRRNLISYDKRGNPVSAMSASGATTAFSYTEEYGNLDSVTDPKGQILAFGYDDLGRGVSSRFADGSETRVECNEKGDVVKTANRRGESVTYEYDGEGRLVKKTWDNGRTFTLAYDAKGNIVSAADSETGTVTMEYDANERLTRIVYPKNRGFTYVYDDFGRVTERAMLGGTGSVPSAAATQRYAYDSLGRLATVTDGDGNHYLTNAYDPTTGRLITQTYGNGTVVSNAYDILGRTVGIYHGRARSPSAPPIAFFEYAYDADGKCISQTTAEGTESYTYDADGQLTAVTYPDGTSETFTYDAVGNRVTANTTTYTVNNLNQYTTLCDSASLLEENLEYDLDGNMTRKGDTRYFYDTLNRLVAVTNEAESIRWSCEYDVFGNRVSVTDNGTTTERLFVQGSLPSVAAEYDGEGAVATQHILVGAVRIADVATTPSSSRYYHADLLGSARLLTDGTGATKGTRSFKAFGETRKSDGETTDAGYVGTLGVETDSNGLLFMRNRYYSADTGRFVQMDPIGVLSKELNLYAYCSQSPVTLIDPNGFEGFFSFVANGLKNDIANTASAMWTITKRAVVEDGASVLKGMDLGMDVWPSVFLGPIKGNLVSEAKNLTKALVKKGLGYDGFDDFSKGTMNAGNIALEVALQETKHALPITDFLNKVATVIDAINVIEDDMMEREKRLIARDHGVENFVNLIREKKVHDEEVTETRDVVISWDPNEIKGPFGAGEKRYKQQGDWMDYTIYFENKTNATAAAQEVFVDLPMDPNLDWSTLELGEIAFGDHIDTSLVGKSHGKSSYALPGTNTSVKTEVKIKDGVLSWYIRDWDPTTADNFPTSATGGFLPPNDPATHCGEGHLSYRVRVKSDAPNGAIIRASAQIVFDSNPMIETDPSWWNTVGENRPEVKFDSLELSGNEGESVTISVSGGSEAAAASVKVYLTYGTASAADVDLKTAAVDGVTPKGGLKFPLVLTWEKGEIGEKTIAIPVKTEKTVEGGEFFTLQLADAQGMELGDERVCTVTIHDPGYDELAAKVAAGMATKAEQNTLEKLQKAKAPYIRGVADSAERGKVSGSGLCAAGKKVTLKATANKGFVFVGWADAQIAIDGDRLLPNAVEYIATTPTLVIDRSAKPAKNTATSTTVAGIDQDAAYYACFITSAEDKDSIELSVDGAALSGAPAETSALSTNIWAGVYLEWPVAASALSEPKVKVAGLPAGLKFTDKPVTSKIGSGKTAVTVTNVPANTIYGAPAAASKTTADRKTGAVTVKPSAVKVTVTTAGKSTQTYQIDTTVDALPAWAQGTFAGGVYGRDSGPLGDRALPCGTVSLTVSAAGKVSGKATAEGLAYTLAAPYYTGFEMAEGESYFLADVTANWSYKEGSKTVKTNDVALLTVRDNGIGGIATGGPRPVAADPDVAAGDGRPPEWTAWQYNWKVEPWKTLGKSFAKKTLAYAILPDGSFSEGEAALTSALGAEVTGRVTLKFAASGTVSVAGKFVTGYNDKTKKYTTVKATGSATLVPVDGEHAAVFIYLAPKNLQIHSRSLAVPWSEE